MLGYSAVAALLGLAVAAGVAAGWAWGASRRVAERLEVEQAVRRATAAAARELATRRHGRDLLDGLRDLGG